MNKWVICLKGEKRWCLKNAWKMHLYMQILKMNGSVHNFNKLHENDLEFSLRKDVNSPFEIMYLIIILVTFFENSAVNNLFDQKSKCYLKWVWRTVAKQIIISQKFNIPISINISIRTQQFVCIRQPKLILDITWPLNHYLF